MWAFMEGIVRAGQTFCWDTAMTSGDARDYWLRPFPARAVVAVDPDGTILGTAESGPNKGGPGAHIASARADGYLGMQFNAVAASNTRAVALWQSVGMTILCTVPGGFRHPTQGLTGLHIMYQPL
jgi:hypothetical protein